MKFKTYIPFIDQELMESHNHIVIQGPVNGFRTGLMYNMIASIRNNTKDGVNVIFISNESHSEINKSIHSLYDDNLQERKGINFFTGYPDLNFNTNAIKEAYTNHAADPKTHILVFDWSSLYCQNKYVELQLLIDLMTFCKENDIFMISILAKLRVKLGYATVLEYTKITEYLVNQNKINNTTLFINTASLMMSVFNQISLTINEKVEVFDIGEKLKLTKDYYAGNTTS